MKELKFYKVNTRIDNREDYPKRIIETWAIVNRDVYKLGEITREYNIKTDKYIVNVNLEDNSLFSPEEFEYISEKLSAFRDKYEDLKFYARLNAMTQDIDSAPSFETEDVSDGYHTIGDMYYHKMITFAALCNAYPDKAWKSRKHHDGTMFGDKWYIVGIETPAGNWSYHFDTGWEMFKVHELEHAPKWDGHKDYDVVRLLSLQNTVNKKETVDDFKTLLTNYIEADVVYSNTAYKKLIEYVSKLIDKVNKKDKDDNAD